jgi:predicted dehydrogenase
MSARTPYRLSQKGVLVQDYTHQIDYLGWFFGSVTEVTARGGVLGDLPMRPDPNLMAALLCYDSGAVASLHLDYIQHPQRHTLELYGDKGTLVFNFETCILEEYVAALPGARTEPISYFRDNMFRDEHAAFFESMKSRVPAVSAAEGIEAMRVAEAILTSAERRSPITL